VGTGQKLGHSSGRFGAMVNRKVKTSDILFICCALSVITIFSCGVFSPRASETPEPTGKLDPLNFKKIMTGTGEQFTKPLYEDYFADGDIYEDINSGLSSKDRLIQWLHSIIAQQKYRNILVEWTNKPDGIYKNSSNDTMVLSGLTYAIYFSGTPGTVPDDSGSSNITLVKNLEWRIAFWKDMPVGNQKSFFSP
jgi:hypothetical protein